jgi:hypothetical protein
MSILLASRLIFVVVAVDEFLVITHVESGDDPDRLRRIFTRLRRPLM